MRTARQVAVIAVRGRSRQLEVCLIRRRDKSKWRIPKGFIDPGDSPEQAALKEASEEAGLSGRIIGSRVGTYEYDKWRLRLTVAVYLMDVTEEQRKWREMDMRQRRWYSMKKAGVLLADHPVAPLWDRINERLRSRGAGD